MTVGSTLLNDQSRSASTDLGRLSVLIYPGPESLFRTGASEPSVDDFRQQVTIMTMIITALERSPDGGKGLSVIRAFAGRLKKWVGPIWFALFRSVR